MAARTSGRIVAGAQAAVQWIEWRSCNVASHHRASSKTGSAHKCSTSLSCRSVIGDPSPLLQHSRSSVAERLAAHMCSGLRCALPQLLPLRALAAMRSSLSTLTMPATRPLLTLAAPPPPLAAAARAAAAHWQRQALQRTHGSNQLRGLASAASCRSSGSSGDAGSRGSLRQMHIGRVVGAAVGDAPVAAGAVPPLVGPPHPASAAAAECAALQSNKR